MEKLKKKIEAEGTCLGTDLIKVDAFLNHQIDPVLMEEIATTFYEQVKDLPITKIVTIESGGIAPAYALATKLRVPLLFMKRASQTRWKIRSIPKFFLTRNKSVYVVRGT